MALKVVFYILKIVTVVYKVVANELIIFEFP
jgi:hypothetical protein